MSDGSNELDLRVDEDDLKKRRWTCSKYSKLHGNVSQCDAVFESSIKFRVHIRRYHQNPRFPAVFMCPVEDCKLYSKKFSRFQYLRNHYDSLHRTVKSYECDVCRKLLGCKKSYKRHVKDCRSPLLQCSYCTLSYTTHSSLKRHFRTSHIKEISEKGKHGTTEQPLNISHTKYLLVEVNKNPDIAVRILSVLNPPSSDTPSQSSSEDSQEHLITPSSPAPYYQDNNYPYPKRQKVSAGKSTWEDQDQNISDLGWDRSQKQAWGEKEPDMWSEPVLKNPCAGEYVEGDVLHDKDLYSAIDNITTQTDNFWELNELSTQTVTEHQSFGTQTAQIDDVILDRFLDCDLVEYLDGAVQTEIPGAKTDSVCFAAQTSISAENFSNDRSCGVDRLDRDCQTYYYKSSTHTQTNMLRERALVVADGMNTETQTTSPHQQCVSEYNENCTQTTEEYEQFRIL